MNLDELGRALRRMLETDEASMATNLAETLVGLLLIFLFQQLLYRLIDGHIHEIDRRQQIRIWARTALFALVAVLLIMIWLPSSGSMIQVLAILAAGLAVTLSRPILSLLAWSVIVVRTPFRVGDRIQVGTVQGDVIDIGLLRIHILEIGNWVNADQSTGRVVHVPNTVIFDGPLFNYTEAFNLIWNEITVVLTHDSDWELGQTLLLAQAEPLFEAIRERAATATEAMTRRYAYHRGVITPFVYVRLLRDGIELTLRYLTPPQRRRGSSHEVTTGFLRALQAAPTVRLAPPAYRIVMDGMLSANAAASPDEGS